MADGTVVIQVKNNAASAAKDFDRLDKSLDRTEKELKDVDKAADKTSKAMKALSFAIPALALIEVIKTAAETSKALVNIASSAEETENKFKTAFRGIEGQAEQTAQTLAESYLFAEDEAKALLASTGDLLKGFGFTTEEALELSTKIQQLGADLTSYNNFAGGAAGASEILTKALLGERDALVSLGTKLNDTDLEEFAEKQGLVYKELTKSEKAWLTYNAVVAQNQDAIGDVSRSYESYANQTKIAAGLTQDLQVALGNQLLPTATDIVEVFNDVARAIKAAYAPSQEQRLKQIAFDLNEASLELNQFTKDFNGSFLRAFDGLEASATPQFKALTEQIKTLKAEQTDLQKTLAGTGSESNVAEDENNPIVKQTDLLKKLQEEANKTKIELQNLFLQGEEDSDQFTKTKAEYDAITDKINKAKDATKSFEKATVDSFDFAGAAADNFSRNATRSLFEPWEEGETAADRFKQVALDTIADILAEFIAAELKKQAVALVTAVLTGGSSAGAGFASSFIPSAKGNAFSNGSVTDKFANGGAFTNSIVSSPTTFPMAGGRTGLMGEAGPEAIMPLDRDNQGRLGVQVQQSPVVNNIYNNAPVQVETVSRPNNQNDIYISLVNNALSSSQTSVGVSDALSRTRQSGNYGV